MKWFKHISDSLDDPFIFDLIDKFGGTGYLVFFGTLEILAREFDVSRPGLATFSIQFLQRKLQVRYKRTLIEILNFCNENNRILVEIDKNDDNKIMLNCPKLRALCDDWTQKQIRENSEVNLKLLRRKSPTNKREREIKEEDKEKEKKERERKENGEPLGKNSTLRDIPNSSLSEILLKNFFREKKIQITDETINLILEYYTQKQIIVGEAIEKFVHHNQGKDYFNNSIRVHEEIIRWLDNEKNWNLSHGIDRGLIELGTEKLGNGQFSQVTKKIINKKSSNFL